MALIAAAVVGAVLAVLFTAAVVVISLMAIVVLVLAGAAVRARHTVRRAERDPNLIEARHIGGHSWVAYGWDGRR